MRCSVLILIHYSLRRGIACHTRWSVSVRSGEDSPDEERSRCVSTSLPTRANYTNDHARRVGEAGRETSPWLDCSADFRQEQTEVLGSQASSTILQSELQKDISGSLGSSTSHNRVLNKSFIRKIKQGTPPGVSLCSKKNC